MTREEYKAKLKGLHPQMDCDLKWKYTQEYIASLEAWIAELEAEVRVYKFALENAIIDRTLGGNTPLAQYVAEARAELNRQAQEEK